MYRLLTTPFQRENQPVPSEGLEVWCSGTKFTCDGEFPEEFLTAVERVVRLSYRISIKPIAKHPDGPSPALQNLAAVVRLFPSAGLSAVRQVAFTDTMNFHSDVGWGCMIRTAQSVLANALLRALNEYTDQYNCLGQPLSQHTKAQKCDEHLNDEGLNRKSTNKVESTNTSDTISASTHTHETTEPAPEPVPESVLGPASQSTELSSQGESESPSTPSTLSHPNPVSEMSILSQFADEPEARYSIHKFVAFGEHCGVLPGEWFGPSTAAACIAEFSELPVYRSDGADIYEQDLLDQLDASPKGILVLSNLRLGIDQVNPVYYNGIKTLLKQKQSVGIAGGRTSASLYFFGCTEDYLLYNDPHEPRQALSITDSEPQVRASLHSRLLRWLPIADLDPSMLVAVYLKDGNDYAEWKQNICTHSQNSEVLQFVPGKKPACVMLEDEGCEDHEGFFVCDLIN